MSNKPLTHTAEWKALSDHKVSISPLHMRDLFEQDAERFSRFHTSIPGMLFDYSKHKITDETMEQLIALAQARDVEGQRKRMITGEVINTTEDRAVLHMALRGSCGDDVNIDGENVDAFVQDSLKKTETVSEDIRREKSITDVVNIGIGGSDLGPRMAYKALKPFADGPNVHFISNVDGSALSQLLKKIKPVHTVFIVSSKSFSTQETITNAETVKSWLLKEIDEQDLARHLVAVTANEHEAQAFGVNKDRVLPMGDWVGGRYSLWSAIGLPLAIAFGFKTFKALLDGGRAMDEHFLNAPLDQNIPVIMALLGVWYRNFWDYPAQAILPYSHDLRDFPIFMQQMDMESNGKSVTHDGTLIEHSTGPVVFGESGTNSQHTFMQLLHQSPEIVPADFIVFAKPQHKLTAHHEKLLGHALAQSKTLMEGQENQKEPHRHFPGNRPSSTLILDTLDAHHLGMLIALYEHKIFVQGALWGVNSFDQWGVELGKINAEKIIQDIEKQNKMDDFDSSTSGLLDHLTQKFIKS